MKGYENSKVPRLFELMEKRKIKAVDLSRATGITTGSITDWKVGKSIPTGERLVALCQFFDVTASELLGISVSDQVEFMVKNMVKTEGKDGSSSIIIPFDLSPILDEAKDLDEKQKKDVLDYIKFIKFKSQEN